MRTRLHGSCPNCWGYHVGDFCGFCGLDVRQPPAPNPADPPGLFVTYGWWRCWSVPPVGALGTTWAGVGGLRLLARIDPAWVGRVLTVERGSVGTAGAGVVMYRRRFLTWASAWAHLQTVMVRGDPRISGGAEAG